MAPSVSDTRGELLSELNSLTENSGRLLTSAQVALLLGVCDRTVRIWAKKKQIPAIHNPSGHWRFAALEIMQTYKTGIQEVQSLSK
jgi:Helix-turn-helix domain